MAAIPCMLAGGLRRMIGRAASVYCDIVHAQSLLVSWLVWAAGGEPVRYRLAWPALLVRKTDMQRTIKLRLSASELLDRIADLISPPRISAPLLGGASTQLAVAAAGGGAGWPEAGGE